MALIENKAIDLQNNRMIRGYYLTEFIGYESATMIYHAQTEELWLPPEITIRLFPLPDAFSQQDKTRFINNFTSEAKRMVRLRHSALFPLFGYGEQDGIAYLLMPSIPGETLATQIKHRDRWKPREALLILTPLADAIEMLHEQGLIYQFLRPATILITNEQLPQITCLRLAQMIRVQRLRTSYGHPAHLQAFDGSYLGEPEYLAPEVIKGNPPDPRSDIYSLGVIFFELLSGQTPFSGEDYLTVARKHLFETPTSLLELAPHLPAQLEIVLNHALHPEPQYRFQTVRDFITACTHAVEGSESPEYISLLALLIEQKQNLPAAANLDYQTYIASMTASDEVPMLFEDDLPPSSPADQVADAWLNAPQGLTETVPVTRQTDPIPKQSLENTTTMNTIMHKQIHEQKKRDMQTKITHSQHKQSDSQSIIDATFSQASSLY